MSAIDYDAFLAKLKGYQPDTPAVASEKNREDGTTCAGQRARGQNDFHSDEIPF